jgi:succinoglycan biosynthesis protein ExoW
VLLTVAVVIPYFQTRAGILSRALNSVLAQKLPPDTRVEIIVVDDGSPHRARAEIGVLALTEEYGLTVIEQPNAGVSCARNAALRAVPRDTTFIAFLDSDDIWHPDHRATALKALGNDGDFYFCDTRRLNMPQTAFSGTGFTDFIAANGTARGDDLYQLDSTAFFDRSIRRGHAYRTPTVVYRRAAAPDLMFDRSLRLAGEDCLFFFELLGRCKSIRCSTRLLVTCADGVNIHSSKSTWDDPGHLAKHMAQLLAFARWRQRLWLSPEHDRLIVGSILRARALFAFLTIRYFLKKRVTWSMELRDMVRADPDFLRWYPRYAAYVSVCFPLRLYKP